MVVSLCRLTELCQHIMLATWDRDMPDDLGRAYDVACMLHEEIRGGRARGPALIARTTRRLESAWARHEAAMARRSHAIGRGVAAAQGYAASHG